MFLHAHGNVRIGRVRLFIKQTNDAHNHAGRAIAALESAFSKESFLNWMQFLAFAEAFDCDDGFFVGIGNGSETRGNAFAVQENGAGAALAFATAVLGAGELEILAKDIKQRAFGIGGDRVGTPVDSKFKSRVHRRFGQCAALVCYYTQHLLQRQQSPELARAALPRPERFRPENLLRLAGNGAVKHSAATLIFPRSRIGAFKYQQARGISSATGHAQVFDH